MGISRLLRRIWYGPPLVTSAEEIATGGAIVEGTAEISGATLSSPLTGTTCIAYRYRATYKTPSRTQGMAERVLKDVEVYAQAFDLLVDGARVRVIPLPGGEFDSQEHQKLQSGGFRGFSAVEHLIRHGARVRVKGRLSREEGEKFVLRSKKIEIVKETDAGPLRRQRASQRKKQKNKKKG